MAKLRELKIGLALSGGGALGAVHIGALKALEDGGINLHHVTGISAGAIVGGLYCSGNSPEEILGFFKLDSLLELVRIKNFGSGLIDNNHFQEIVKKNCKSDEIADLKIKLSIGATNLTTGEFEVFEKGQLSKIAGASSAVPLLMKPVMLDGQQYIDGGIINNLLVEPLQNSCDFVIGINANFHSDWPEVNGIKEVAKRCFEIIAGSSVRANSHHCDHFVEMKKADGYALFDFKNSKELYEIGFETMMAEIDQIKKKIEEK